MNPAFADSLSLSPDPSDPAFFCQAVTCRAARAEADVEIRYTSRMTACSKHPGTLAGANLRELLAECERLLGQVDQLRAAESDQFELIDALARDIDTDAVKLANEALLKLRLALPQSRRD